MTAQTRQPTVAPSRLPALSGLLLAVSTALFTLGVVLERAGHAESGEHAEGEAGATLLGLPLESPALVAAAVLVSVLLAVAVWRRPGVPELAAVALFAVGAAVLDGLEVAHHLDGGRTGIAAIAALVTLTHLAAAGAALPALARRC